MTIIYSDVVVDGLIGAYISPIYFDQDNLEKAARVYSDDKDIIEAYKKANIEVLPLGLKKEVKKTLLELYNEDKNIVDTLNEKQLKSLCKSLDILFTTVEEIKEHLKTLEPLN